MAKKKKKPMDVQTRIALHRSITEKMANLIARAEHLRDQGKLEEARKLLVRIEQLATELKGLEK